MELPIICPVNRSIEQSRVPAVVQGRPTIAELTVSNQAVHEPLVVRAKALLGQFFDRQSLKRAQNIGKAPQMGHLIALDDRHDRVGCGNEILFASYWINLPLIG